MPAFARRGGMNGERMHAAGKLRGKGLIDQAVALDASHSFEQFRHYINSEMRLPARTVPGMAFMLVRFVHDLQALRSESFGQLPGNDIDRLHANRIR